MCGWIKLLHGCLINSGFVAQHVLSTHLYSCFYFFFITNILVRFYSGKLGDSRYQTWPIGFFPFNRSCANLSVRKQSNHPLILCQRNPNILCQGSSLMNKFLSCGKSEKIVKSLFAQLYCQLTISQKTSASQEPVQFQPRPSDQ